MKRTSQDILPTVALRVPGPWNNASDLAARLPDRVRLRDDWLIMSTGQHLVFELMPADQEFPTVFQASCKRPLKPGEVRGLERYASNAVVVGSGGSRVAAAALLRVGSVLLEAGGLGVFIDNSLAAHRREDWLELNQHWQDPDALCYAFAGLVRVGGEVFSHGMHALGFRDAAIEAGDRPAEKAEIIDAFLRTVCRDGQTPVHGDRYEHEDESVFRLAREDSPVLMANHPTHNPYGRWRLIAETE